MNLKATLYILLIASTQGLSTLKNYNTFFPFKNLHFNNLGNNNFENNNLSPVLNNVDKINNKFLNEYNILNHECHLKDKISYFIEDNQRNIGRQIVMKISSFLPEFDQIGHNVLHANNEFISYILSLDYVNDVLKKEIILTSIKFAQYGDDFGSYLLQMYYDIVNYSL